MKIMTGLFCAIALCGEDRQVIDRSFTLPAGPRTVEIRGISGYIRVTGTEGNGVTFHVEQRLDARTSEGLVRLREEVKLRFTESGGVVRAEVEKRDRDWEKGQKIEHDFTVTVPRDVRLIIRNVNGEITVDVAGEKRGTKWVYRSDGKATTRVGKGGPLFALSGLNSEILIHSSGK